ncbi:protein-(glutamine-N5) methyltransferase, release factor-specific [PVC group bacterium (ex Bugula neritina AB1)]|nr:protein-(glutamine-N5) methyltransferase, release factor-specific [PVC group bacterium (ex Bugula neritina AB1)]
MKDTEKVTFKEAVLWGQDQLSFLGKRVAERNAEDLILHVSKVSLENSFKIFSSSLKEKQWEDYRALIFKAKEGVPLQYLLGTVPFMDCGLKVNPDVLIPRPETEELCEKILKRCEEVPPQSILDIGTGSGAIAIALAQKWSDANVVALDICEKALRVAQFNVEKYDLSKRIKLLKSDLFDNCQGNFDLIVSNPPYISEEEMEEVPSLVKDHEPMRALLGGKSGIDIYEKFSKNVHDFLNKDGLVALEIGETQGDILRILFQNQLGVEVEVEKDMQGKERFIFFTH